MLQVLFEQWIQSGGIWDKSQLLLQARSSKKGSKTGARRWMLRSDIVKKYGGCEETADEIIKAKEKECASSVKPHPELPHREDMKLYLCWDEAFECDTEDLVIDQMLSLSQTDRHGGRGRSRTKKDRKGSKKHKKSSSSSSKSSSTKSDSSKDSSKDSESKSSSSSSSDKKRRKKAKKCKKSKDAKSKKDRKTKGKDKKKNTKSGKGKKEDTSPEGSSGSSASPDPAALKKEAKRKREEAQKEKQDARKREREAAKEEQKKAKDEENQKKKEEKEKKQQAEKEKQKIRASGKKAWGMVIMEHLLTSRSQYYLYEPFVKTYELHAPNFRYCYSWNTTYLIV